MTLRHRDSSSSCSQSVVAVWGESCSIWAAMMAAAVQRSSCGSQSLSGRYRGVNVEGHHCDDPLLNYRHNHIITLIRYDYFSLLINRRESSMVGEHRYTAGDKNATVSQRNHGNSAHKICPRVWKRYDSYSNSTTYFTSDTSGKKNILRICKNARY